MVMTVIMLSGCLTAFTGGITTSVIVMPAVTFTGTVSPIYSYIFRRAIGSFIQMVIMFHKLSFSVSLCKDNRKHLQPDCKLYSLFVFATVAYPLDHIVDRTRNETGGEVDRRNMQVLEAICLPTDLAMEMDMHIVD